MSVSCVGWVKRSRPIGKKIVIILRYPLLLKGIDGSLRLTHPTFSACRICDEARPEFRVLQMNVKDLIVVFKPYMWTLWFLCNLKGIRYEL